MEGPRLPAAPDADGARVVHHRRLPRGTALGLLRSRRGGRRCRTGRHRPDARRQRREGAAGAAARAARVAAVPARGARARRAARRFARALLAPSPDPELAARVGALQDSRARIIAAADAERRRLERDLHDGAQQRLVAPSMQLGMAKRRLARGEDVERARRRRRRGAARGDRRAARPRARHPSGCAHRSRPRPRAARPRLRCLVPVELGELPEERLPGPVEAAAYFTVSEALTNVAKYAQASTARVEVGARATALDVAVSDDGVGGAVPGAAPACAGSPTASARSAATSTSSRPPGHGTRLQATCRSTCARAIRPGARPVAAGEPARAPPAAAVARRRLRARDGAARLHLADHGRRLLLAAVADRGLGPAARAARLVRRRPSPGYARHRDATGPMRGGMGAKKKAAKAGVPRRR